MSNVRLRYTQGNDIQRGANQTWYRGENCNFIASKQNLQETDSVDKYILKGWLPGAPFITRHANILVFGSCFALHIAKYLEGNGYKIGSIGYALEPYIIRCGAGMVNTFAIRQQLEWAYEGRNFSENLWHNSEKVIMPYNDKIRTATRAALDHTDIFIMTLGLSEVWNNKITGEVFWRAIPIEQFDHNIHGFRITTVEENKNNLIKIYSIIKKHRPSAKVIFTLSPVPLVATFRPVSCSTANCVSKAILRVAIDEFLRDYSGDKDLYYWPSYEIVTDFSEDPYEDDRRHIKPNAINLIMDLFAKHYCKEGS